jgi:hypothetical protein
MLIQLVRGLSIDPSQFPHRLMVELETGAGFREDPHPECGVFSGMHDGFEEPEEMNHRLLGSPIDEETPWIQRFEIIAPNRSVPHQRRGYHYVAIGWNGGVYMAYPVPTEIQLEDSEGSWSVIIGHPIGVTITMQDYTPWNSTDAQ